MSASSVEPHSKNFYLQVVVFIDLMTTPSNLLNEFNDLFEQQAEIENSKEFKAKKQKYSDLK